MTKRLLLVCGVLSALSACATHPPEPVMASGCPPTVFDIYFARDQVALDSLGDRVLDTTAAALSGCAGGRLEVAGFADPAGDPATNQRISEQRAEAVLQGLLTRGVTAQQVVVLGVGEQGARTGGVTEPMRRRVEVRFIPAGY